MPEEKGMQARFNEAKISRIKGNAAVRRVTDEVETARRIKESIINGTSISSTNKRRASPIWTENIDKGPYMKRNRFSIAAKHMRQGDQQRQGNDTYE